MGHATRLLAVLVVALALVGAACGSDDPSGGRSASTWSATGPEGADTVARNGDPAFCAAIVDFQEAYTAVGEPPPTATPAQVEADWDTLAEAEDRLVENAPDGMDVVVQQVATVFDRFRIDADALGYRYTTFDDFDSSAGIDPTGQNAEAAYTLFTYGDVRCPED